MNMADTLRGLLRRWYIVLPGIILAMAAGIGAYVLIQPGYERTSTQLLLPGEGTVPPGATNPYLYLGGLTQAADVVVRVMQSGEVVGKVVSEYPGTEVLVQRDPTVSGPVIQIVVTATSDAAAAGALSALVEESGVVLDRLQAEQEVTPDDLMSITTVTQDESSALQQKTRMVTSAGAALGLVIVTLLVASLVDGLSRRARRSGRQGTPAGGPASADDVEDAVAEVEPELQFEELSAEEPAGAKAEDVWALIEDSQLDRETTTAGGPSTRGRGSRGPSSRSR
jgi:uncharacterized protein involved in exopolysaccharide biosynthesis